MKKLISLIVLSIFGLLVWGQSQKNEFYITAGIGSGPFMVESFKNSFLDFSGLFAYDSQVEETHKDHVLPVITLGYQYRLSKKIKLGAEILIDRFWIDNRKNSYHFNSIFVRSDFILRETKKVIVYSGISVGITNKRAIENLDVNVNTTTKKIIPGMHLYIIGVDFKLRKFSLTANSGLGMSGILNLGVKYRF